MVHKNKVIIGTIAASLAFTAFAGLPLSQKGIYGKLGVTSVAYAATTEFPNPSLVSWVASLKTALGNDNVLALQAIANDISATEVKNELGQPTSLSTIVAPIRDRLSGFESADLVNLNKLFAGLMTFFFDQDTAKLETLRQDAGIRTALKKLSSDITLADIDTFFFDASTGAQAVVQNKLKSLSLADLASLQLNANARNEFVKSVLADILNGANGSKVRAALDAKGIVAADFEAVVGNFRTAIGASRFDNASAKLAAAYISIATYTSPSTGSGGGTSTVTTPSVEQLKKDLEAAKAKIDAATGDEKQQLIAAAVQSANTVVAALVTIDAAALVQDQNGKAVVALPAAKVTELLTALADAKKALASAVGTSDGIKVPVLTINLSAVTQASTSISLPKELWTLASEANSGGVALVIGGLTATLPVGQFTQDVSFNVTKQADTTGKTGSLPAASDIYSFDLQVGGSAVDQFAKPITIRIPIKDATGLDRELLTVARIEADGTLSIQGGTTDGDYIVEPRHSFSSYVVVENKVTFNDIAKVESWAGRQIQVVAAKGAIEGKSTGTFAPADSVTRAEFAKMLIKALNLDDAQATTSQFSDVKSNDWYAPFVAVAVEQGIITGRTNNTFVPNATITRAEMATMIARALKSTIGLKDVANVDAALSAFTDAGQISSALKAGVALSATNNIVIGANGKFNPNSQATRAEAAVIIYRALNAKA